MKGVVWGSTLERAIKKLDKFKFYKQTGGKICTWYIFGQQ